MDRIFLSDSESEDFDFDDSVIDPSFCPAPGEPCSTEQSENEEELSDDSDVSNEPLQPGTSRAVLGPISVWCDLSSFRPKFSKSVSRPSSISPLKKDFVYFRYIFSAFANEFIYLNVILHQPKT